jgi:hypothetical protein
MQMLLQLFADEPEQCADQLFSSDNRVVVAVYVPLHYTHLK